MRIAVQTHQGKQNYLFQRSEKFSSLHLFYKIEQIDWEVKAKSVVIRPHFENGCRNPGAEAAGAVNLLGLLR